MRQHIDLSGQRFGRLVALKFLGLGQGIWECKCDCGNIRHIPSGALRIGVRTSCGCAHPRSHVNHGYTGTTTHNSWTQMRRRCIDPNHSNYKWYGQRGISYDQRWNDFLVFLADMGECPDRNHTLDRIDPNKNYSKENCRWTPLENTARRNTPMIGDETLREYALRVGLKYHTAYARYKRGKL